MKYLLLILLIINVILSTNINKYRKSLVIEPVCIAPNALYANYLKKEDSQLFFRIGTFIIQNFGNNYGNFTPLVEYDYERLYSWFKFMDNLDKKSNFIPTIATFYYANTKEKNQIMKIVDYLIEYSKNNLEEKWWWLLQATYIAKYKLKDSQLAKNLSKPLIDVKNIPTWAKMTHAIILSDLNEYESAYEVSNMIIQNNKNDNILNDNYMNFFIQEKLPEIKKHLLNQ